MKNFKVAASFLFYMLICLKVASQHQEKVIILDKPGFPLTFELNTGESQIITRSYKGREIKKEIGLISVQAFSELNHWFPDTIEQFDYYQFQINLEIESKFLSILHRPYQMPVTFEGLRIYIENVKQLDESASYGKCGDMKKQVRISVCMENEPWSTQNIVFPINNYLWRSAVYNNTWSSLVPFNLLYYHRGEDYGVIPDLLDVVSPISGVVSQSPLPNGDGLSNAVCVENENGMKWRLSHMNIESIQKEYPIGTSVGAGTILAKTGMTWNGHKTQVSDPHLHVDIMIDGKRLSSFPYLMEAYLRKYPDKMVAIAGGYRFTSVGNPIDLDASRSLSGCKKPLKNYIWKLSNGKTVKGQKATIVYDQTGIYSEELLVENKEGFQDRDFLYVRVFDPARGKNIAYGWAYYYPLRGIKSGTEVSFWNCLVNVTSDVKINFGDDNDWYPIIKETIHKYNSKGKYVVTLKSTGSEGEPVSLKMEVIVEE